VFWHVFLDPNGPRDPRDPEKKEKFPCDIWLAGVYAHAFLGESPWGETPMAQFFCKEFSS